MIPHCGLQRLLRRNVLKFPLLPAVEGKKLISVEELPVQDHYIFYCEKLGPKRTFGVGKLMGEGEDPNPCLPSRLGEAMSWPRGLRCFLSRPLESRYSVLPAECQLQLGRGRRAGMVRDGVDTTLRAWPLRRVLQPWTLVSAPSWGLRGQDRLAGR